MFQKATRNLQLIIIIIIIIIIIRRTIFIIMTTRSLREFTRFI